MALLALMLHARWDVDSSMDNVSMSGQWCWRATDEISGNLVVAHKDWDWIDWL